MAASRSLVTALPVATPHSSLLTLTRRPSNFKPTSPPSPSAEQTAAIITLLPFHESDLVAWLTVIRSIEPNFQYRAGAGHLTKQQLDALSSLATASNDDVKIWLRLHPHQPAGSTQSERFSQCSTIAESRSSWASSIAPDKIDWPILEGPPKRSNESFDYDCTRNVPSEFVAQCFEKSILNVNKPVPQPPSDAHDSLITKGSGRTPIAHYATSQEHNRPIMTCDGFKRHEIEQERSWIFMPSGPIESSPQGDRCALCPTLFPDEEHLRFHGTLQYKSGSISRVKKSRKGEFKKLLKAHKVPTQYIGELVEKWRFIRPKRAYSCGFCVELFSTLSERTSHLCQSHFHRGQNMDHWHVTNLIRGLLLQPEVNEEYRSLYGIDPSSMQSRCQWHSSSMKDLQNRLEMGKESPHDLAVAAHNAMRLPDSLSTPIETLEAGSQFLRHPQTDPASPNPVNQEMKPPISISNPNTVDLSPVTATPQVTSGMYAQQVKEIESCLPPPFTAQTKLDPAFNLPIRSDSLGGYPTHTYLASFGAGNAVETHPTFTGWVPSFAQDNALAENTMSEAAGAYVPTTDSRSLLSYKPEEPYDRLSSSDVIDLYMQDFVDDPAQTVEEGSVQLCPPKRKLSEKSAAVANSRAQTAAPLELQHRRDGDSMWGRSSAA